VKVFILTGSTIDFLQRDEAKTTAKIGQGYKKNKILC
jgi:hypothetical protein